jgi:hypothetical protein
MSGNAQSQDQDLGQGRDMNMEDSEAGFEASSPPITPLGMPSRQLAMEISSSLAQQATKNAGNVILPTKRAFEFSLDSSPGTHAQQRRLLKTSQANKRDHEKAAAMEKVKEARQCLIDAAALLGSSNTEQTRVLNLLEVFRDFTEKKSTPTTANILRSQTTALEKSIRKINTALEKQPENQSQSNHIAKQQDTTMQRPSFADVSRRNIPAPGQSKPITNPSSWTVVGQRNKTIAQESRPVRLVLEVENRDALIKPLELRNSINAEMTKLGFQGLCALSTSKSSKGNLMLYLAHRRARDFVLQNGPALYQLTRFTRVLEDSSCYKVVVHGVSTQEFDTPDGLQQVKEEIETYNIGLKPIGTPIWLTNPEKRRDQQGASILVAFQTEEEAIRAIQHRLFIGGISVRAEKAKDKKTGSTQASTLC